MAVGETSYNQVGDCAEGIARDCESLYLRCAPVADGFDYCGEESTEAWVPQQRQINSFSWLWGLTIEHSIDSELCERAVL